MCQKTFNWVAVAILLAVLTPAAKAQKVAPGDWPMYRHDLEGSGYSPLKQIDASNVTKLAEAWSMPLSERGGLEATPIAVNGVMYRSRHGPHFRPRRRNRKRNLALRRRHGPHARCRVSARCNDNAPRVVFTTFSRKMIELDAATGKPVRPSARTAPSSSPSAYKRHSDHPIQEPGFSRRQRRRIAHGPSRRYARLSMSFTGASGLGFPHRRAAGRSGSRHVAE